MSDDKKLLDRIKIIQGVPAMLGPQQTIVRDDKTLGRDIPVAMVFDLATALMNGKTLAELRTCKGLGWLTDDDLAAVRLWCRKFGEVGSESQLVQIME